MIISSFWQTDHKQTSTCQHRHRWDRRLLYPCSLVLSFQSNRSSDFSSATVSAMRPHTIQPIKWGYPAHGSNAGHDRRQPWQFGALIWLCLVTSLLQPHSLPGPEAATFLLPSFVLLDPVPFSPGQSQWCQEVHNYQFKLWANVHRNRSTHSFTQNPGNSDNFLFTNQPGTFLWLICALPRKKWRLINFQWSQLLHPGNLT